MAMGLLFNPTDREMSPLMYMLPFCDKACRPLQQGKGASARRAIVDAHAGGAHPRTTI
jgi:hypothetical protein